MIVDYKGYLARVELDGQGDRFFGEVINTRDVITFYAKTAKELKRELKISVDEYITACKKLGKSPEKPFSGKFVVRLPVDLHQRIVLLAAKKNVSLNALVTEALEKIAA